MGCPELQVLVSKSPMLKLRMTGFLTGFMDQGSMYSRGSLEALGFGV